MLSVDAGHLDGLGPGSFPPPTSGSRTPPAPAGPASETGGSPTTGSARSHRQTGSRPAHSPPAACPDYRRGESQQDRIGQLLAYLGLFHRLVALESVLLPSILVPEPRDFDRDLLPVDSDRSGVVALSLQGFSRGAVPTVALPGQGLDIFLQDFLGQKAGHVRVMLEQLEFRVDRLVENVSKRLWNRLLLIRAIACQKCDPSDGGSAALQRALMLASSWSASCTNSSLRDIVDRSCQGIGTIGYRTSIAMEEVLP